ncbi:MAG: hypothetical protein U0L73_13155 [Ruminococcus bromii]|nr:hypothetical protein [Ruminococcus bromii]MEE1173088.1 hypothetical protein [Ruminococcus sp.]
MIWLTAVPKAATVAGVLKSKIAMKSSWSKYCSGFKPQRDIREYVILMVAADLNWSAMFRSSYSSKKEPSTMWLMSY